MNVFKDIEEARSYFSDDRFAMDNGMRISELDEKHCTCVMGIEEKHKNALGKVMGGAIFTLADLAFSVIANDAHVPTLSLDADIRFLSNTSEGTLYARAECVKEGKKISIYEVKVSDGEKNIALVTFTGYHLDNGS
ncbi:MAG: PaaI family thioesterase [Erysipelotrichaceae bacterium]|nr:PaaI family thioesterase [Erysipelotrichaceae bacterium]